MIEVKGLSLSFTKEYFALYNINLSIQTGEKVALLGDSESGKTTLLRVLSGLESFRDGEVFFDNINIKQIDFSKDIELGYLSAKPVFFNNQTVYDNLYYVLKIRHIDEVNAAIKINEALKYYQIENIKELKIKTLSPFQKLRVQFARISLRKIDIYLIDNIFNNLTMEEEETLTKYVEALLKQPATLLIATSKESLAKKFATRIIKLKYGSIEKGEK